MIIRPGFYYWDPDIPTEEPRDLQGHGQLAYVSGNGYQQKVWTGYAEDPDFPLNTSIVYLSRRLCKKDYIQELCERREEEDRRRMRDGERLYPGEEIGETLFVPAHTYVFTVRENLDILNELVSDSYASEILCEQNHEKIIYYLTWFAVHGIDIEEDENYLYWPVQIDREKRYA